MNRSSYVYVFGCNSTFKRFSSPHEAKTKSTSHAQLQPKVTKQASLTLPRNFSFKSMLTRLTVLNGTVLLFSYFLVVLCFFNVVPILPKIAIHCIFPVAKNATLCYIAGFIFCLSRSTASVERTFFARSTMYRMAEKSQDTIHVFWVAEKSQDTIYVFLIKHSIF